MQCRTGESPPPLKTFDTSVRRHRYVRRSVTTLSAALVTLVGLGSSSAWASPGTTGPCDFDGDGYDDLAVGTPGENVGGDDAAGAVSIIYGGPGGLSSASDQLFTQDSANIDGAVEEGDSFGANLACADFNDDGWDDLAIGAPNENLGGKDNAGAVHIVFGTPFGLHASLIEDQLLHLDNFGVESASAGDALGSSLAAADFDGDGYADLAIGAPAWDEDEHNAGAVAIVYGTPSGLSSSGTDFFHQDSPGVVDSVGSRDRYGEVLVSGDFDDDGYADLAIGIPLDNFDDDHGNSGKVHIMYGTGSGLSASGDQRFQPGTKWKNGLFGAALASGDFDDDGIDDLAVGAPGQWVSGQEQAGAVYVLRGSGTGITLTGDQTWSQAGSIVGVPEDFDRFGQALASGDFDDDGIADLAIGAPGEEVGDERHAGMVNVLLGTPSGLSSTGNTGWHQDTPGLAGTAMAGDTFGRTLSVGDYDNDGNFDLAVGVPGDVMSGHAAAGTVHVLQGTWSVFDDDNDIRWSQDSSGIAGGAEDNDMFGGPMASTGIYRIPYANGTDVLVWNDVYNHTLRMDVAGVGPGEFTLVAAADGIVREVVESNFETPDGSNQANNRVWIEHPNGEWTKYTHMRQWSVPNNVVEGQPITAGTIVGIEDDVGHASGEHLHFHVLAVDDPASGVRQGNYRVPRFCGAPGGHLATGETYTAAEC